MKRTLWSPVLPLRSIFTWSPWETNESTEGDEESPGNVLFDSVLFFQFQSCIVFLDIIPGIDIKSQDLGQAEPRNADALPPSDLIELLGSRIYDFISGLGGGNSQYALKAGVMSY